MFEPIVGEAGAASSHFLVPVSMRSAHNAGLMEQNTCVGEPLRSSSSQQWEPFSFPSSPFASFPAESPAGRPFCAAFIEASRLCLDSLLWVDVTHCCANIFADKGLFALWLLSS